jgi:hypothetical protein
MVMSRHQNIGQNHNLPIAKVLWTCGKVKILWNNSNKSELHSRRNEEWIKFRESLLPFCSESLCFPISSMKYVKS